MVFVLSLQLINVMGVSISTGLSAACDTLISQTYGSGNLKRVGLILQRGVLILLLSCFPCCAVLLNTESILLAVKQSPKVAQVAQVYVNAFLPCLPAVFLFQLQGRYLQMQGIIWPQVVTGAIGNVLNAIVNAIFLYVLDLGVVGSAVANAFSQFFLAGFLFILIYCTGMHKPTWSGWSLDCLQDWGMFIRVAIPSMIMVCMEWWTYEIGGILAGLISEIELGAQSILHQLFTILYMFPMGMGIASSARVGNALGSGNVGQAISSYKVAVICTFAVSFTMGLIFGSTKSVVGYIFTTDKKIIERVAETTIICAFLHPADAMLGVTSGIFRGAGKERIGAIFNLVGYYVFGLPIGLALMFVAKLGIVGLWSGLFVCVLLQAMLFNIILWKLNWNKAAEEAKIRAGVKVEDRRDITAAATGGSELQANIISLNNMDHEEFNSDREGLKRDQDEMEEAAKSPPLSDKQLLLRRGLATLVMVLILGAGILINKIVVKLLK